VVYGKLRGKSEKILENPPRFWNNGARKTSSLFQAKEAFE
jgi:hypothetical protein